MAGDYLPPKAAPQVIPRPIKHWSLVVRGNPGQRLAKGDAVAVNRTAGSLLHSRFGGVLQAFGR